MASYEVDGTEHHSPELRYDMGFTSSYPMAPDGLANGLNYNNHEYDWSHHHSQENVYSARAMYGMHEGMDHQQHGSYLGYPPQGDMGVLQAPPYMPASEMAFATPLGHVPYNGQENYFGQHYSAISPSSTGSNSSAGSTGHGGVSQKPKRKRVQSVPQRKAANVRERRRMFHLNEAFDELRKRLPAFNYEKRLSRIETLRLAMTYIAFMKDISDGKEPDDVQLLEIQRKSEEQFPDDSDDSE